MTPTRTPFALDLFTYGSLMCEDIMAYVAGEQLRATPALLPGFHRFLVKDEHYPGVVPDPTGTVTGLVYHTISLQGWSRLDAFEGEMYDRLPVTVRLGNHTEAQVFCYVFRPRFSHRLTATEWDYAAFLQNGKELFKSRYRGFKTMEHQQAG
jgi:gamma-glutamylcyclotransferase (GGCT)/AIG2-like uncharacterized protein YtfP